MTAGIKKVFVTPLTAVDSTDKEGVGTLRFEGNSIYKYVKLANVTATIAVAAGDPVAYLTATGFTTHTVVSDMTDADAQPIGAGILMGTVAGVLAIAYYCWIKTRGPATITTALVGTPVVGSGLMSSTTDKTLTLATGVISPIATCQHVANKLILCNFPF